MITELLLLLVFCLFTSLVRISNFYSEEKLKCFMASLSSCLKCYYDEKMLFLFSLDSYFTLGKNSPCQLLRVNFTRFRALRTKFCCFAYQISWVHTLKFKLVSK